MKQNTFFVLHMSTTNLCKKDLCIYLFSACSHSVTWSPVSASGSCRGEERAPDNGWEDLEAMMSPIGSYGPSAVLLYLPVPGFQCCLPTASSFYCCWSPGFLWNHSWLPTVNGPAASWDMWCAPEGCGSRAGGRGIGMGTNKNSPPPKKKL